jgi:hypothetical protein
MSVPHPQRRDLQERWWTALFLAGLLALTGYMAWFCLHGGFTSFSSDSGSYLLLARKWSPWFNPSLAELGTWPPQAYPPVWPVLLALTGVSESLWWSHLLTLLLGSAAVWLAWIWLRSELGPRQAGALCILYLLLPGTLLNSMPISAENSFLLLSMAVLGWHQHIQGLPLQQRNPAHYLLLWILLVMAVLDRSIGVALIPALLLAQPSRAKLWVCLGALAAYACWGLVDPQSHLPDYFSLLKLLSWSEAHTALRINLASLPGAWYQVIAGPAQNILAWLIGILSLVTVLFYTLRRAAGGAADALYCLAYLMILLLWPFPTDDRFLQPIILLLLAQPLLAARNIGIGLGTVLLLPLCLGQSVIVQRAIAADANEHHSRDYYHQAALPTSQLLAVQYAAIYRQMAASGAMLGDEDTVASVKPAYYALLAQRKAVPLRAPKAPEMACRELPGQVSHLFFSALVSGYNTAGLDAIEAYKPWISDIAVMAGTTDNTQPALLATLKPNWHSLCSAGLDRSGAGDSHGLEVGRPGSDSLQVGFGIGQAVVDGAGAEHGQ